MFGTRGKSTDLENDLRRNKLEIHDFQCFEQLRIRKSFQERVGDVVPCNTDVLQLGTGFQSFVEDEVRLSWSARMRKPGRHNGKILDCRPAELDSLEQTSASDGA